MVSSRGEHGGAAGISSQGWGLHWWQLNVPPGALIKKPVCWLQGDAAGPRTWLRVP